MAELNAADVASFTNGRLPNNADTTDLLNAALTAARRYCGWHVSPVRVDDVVDVDGPGGRVLSLPTLNLIAVDEVSEDGRPVTGELDVSRRKGTVEKRGGTRWTGRAGGIVATITHGYTEAEAGDWRRAVLRLVDAMSRETVTLREDPALVRKKIDDVDYQWAEGLIDSDARLAALLAQFRILPSP